MGTGALGTIQQQLQYNLTVYALVAAAAIRALKALPLTDEGDHLSKILQEPSKPFSDFVDQLTQVVEQFFGGLGNTMPMVKQQAYENANKYYKKALCPHQKKSLNGYIWIC